MLASRSKIYNQLRPSKAAYLDTAAGRWKKSHTPLGGEKLSENATYRMSCFFTFGLFLSGLENCRQPAHQV